MPRRTFDKAYFSDQNDITKKMSRTPEGFLLCQDVPIARIGEQIYGPDETAIDEGPDGLVYIARDEAEVFRPETIASFEGKDVVDDHPEEEGAVTPDNWRDLSVGHVQNVRRGEGLDSDYLIADLIIKCPDAIKAVQSGKREVSCGYDAKYEQTAPGRGRQYDIIGNHVALVERGRCGPRCAIRDSYRKEQRMPLTTDAADDLEQTQRLAEEQFSRGNSVYILSLPRAGEDAGYESEDNGDAMNIYRVGGGQGREFVCSVAAGQYRLETDNAGAHLYLLPDDEAERQPLAEMDENEGGDMGEAGAVMAGFGADSDRAEIAALKKYADRQRAFWGDKTKATEPLRIDRTALSNADNRKGLAAINARNRAVYG